MSAKVGHSRLRQYIAAVDEELYLELVNVEAKPLREMPLAGMNETQKKTSKTDCVHANDAHERSCTSDDHETERPSEWIRNLETFSGRVGAGTRRTVPSDAWRSGNDVCDSMRHRVQTRFRTRSKQQYWQHNPQDPEWRRHVGLNATRLQEYEALKSEWKAMHQASAQWGIADGNTPTNGS